MPETTHQKQSTLVFWLSLVNLRIKATTFGNKDNKYKEKIKEYIFYRKKKKKRSSEGPNTQAPGRNKLETVQTLDIRNIMKNKTKKRFQKNHWKTGKGTRTTIQAERQYKHEEDHRPK